MRIAGISLFVDGVARPIAPGELDRCERLLGAQFPKCYRDFVMQVGAGYFQDIPVRVSAPQHILDTTPKDRERLRQYWFWHDSEAILTQEQGIQSIQCFDTDIGHDIRYLPVDSSVFYLLSRDDSSIVRCRDLSDVLKFVFDGEETPAEPYTFTPYSK